MTKNLIILAGFLAIIVGMIFLISPTDSPADRETEPVAKTRFVELASGMKKGKALFTLYDDLPPYDHRPPVPDVEITDEKGNILTLNDLKGQNLLINFWATWCVPCREEMPELDALQAARGSDDFKVIIISVDRGGLEASRKFLDDIGIENLDLYYDEKGRLARKMKSIGYPSTILVDRSGRQFGHMTGPAHWNSASAHALIDRLIAAQ